MIDFHCHLDLFPNPSLAVADIDRLGVYTLSVTTTPKAFPKTAQLAKARKRIRTALGLHPQLVHERHAEVGLFVRLINETSYVGEIGIDGGDEFARHLDVQREVFDRLLQACAEAGGKTMSIHSRHASEVVLDSLERHPTAGAPILHWFSGPVAQAERAVKLGAWFSVGPTMAKGSRAASLLAKIPRDRILTETDAPFSSMVGDHYPAGAFDQTVQALSRLYRCDVPEVRRQLADNLRALVSMTKRFQPMRTGRSHSI
ncbi:MAG: hydrolase TatD [Ancylobacter novellus]|uniref:Hydrolase TatD n=1 Tax=Ancylobacter novellus TaxID=921 RepID=A0A2W5LYE3_ANCNO|nr:MAG: hydrolase TatD [Ancylobacter novellus]